MARPPPRACYGLARERIHEAWRLEARSDGGVLRSGPNRSASGALTIFFWEKCAEPLADRYNIPATDNMRFEAP
jgi:hypothetical protein